MSEPISDERLAELIAKLEAHVGKLTEVDGDKCMLAALRELQQLRAAVVAHNERFKDGCHHEQDPKYCPEAAQGYYCEGCPKLSRIEWPANT